MYKRDYMAFDEDKQEPKEFVIVREKTILVHYTVEAENMSDAVLQMEKGNYDCVIDEDASDVVTHGRIVSARVNDDD